jgi:hypothetical protein
VSGASPKASRDAVDLTGGGKKTWICGEDPLALFHAFQNEYRRYRDARSILCTFGSVQPIRAQCLRAYTPIHDIGWYTSTAVPCAQAVSLSFHVDMFLMDQKDRKLHREPNPRPRLMQHISGLRTTHHGH